MVSEISGEGIRGRLCNIDSICCVREARGAVSERSRGNRNGRDESKIRCEPHAGWLGIWIGAGVHEEDIESQVTREVGTNRDTQCVVGYGSTEYEQSCKSSVFEMNALMSRNAAMRARELSCNRPTEPRQWMRVRTQSLAADTVRPVSAKGMRRNMPLCVRTSLGDIGST